MKNNYSFLFEKSKIENFLNEKKLFGEKKIKVLEINRSYTYNPDAYNVFYQLDVDGEKKKIRASGSTILEKKKNFEILKYLYKHGFDKGHFLVVTSLAYFEDENVFFYEDATGLTLMDELSAGKNLEEKINLAGQALQKIHALDKNDFGLGNDDFLFSFNDFERQKLGQYYPEIEKRLDEIILQIKNKISLSKKEVVCHGDYQINNLLDAGDKLYILDFDLICLSDQEMDIANFLCQLKIMLERFGNPADFEKYQQNFLNGYGVNNFSLSKIAVYNAIMNLRILITFCTSQGIGKEDNTQFLPIIFEDFKQDLEKISSIDF